MARRLSLFPDSPLKISTRLKDEKLADLATILNPIDEVFAASPRFGDSRNVVELLRFIARLPGYSAFNGSLLCIQFECGTTVNRLLRRNGQIPLEEAQKAPPIIDDINFYEIKYPIFG